MRRDLVELFPIDETVPLQLPQRKGYFFAALRPQALTPCQHPAVFFSVKAPSHEVTYGWAWHSIFL